MTRQQFTREAIVEAKQNGGLTFTTDLLARIEAHLNNVPQRLVDAIPHDAENVDAWRREARDVGRMAVARYMSMAESTADLLLRDN